MLFHFSEDPSISKFHPRQQPEQPCAEHVVWAIDAEHAPIYYFPRDCPRVCFAAHVGSSTNDVSTFLAHTNARRVIAIESTWLDRVRSATLYQYELPSEEFVLNDQPAGYYVCPRAVIPVRVAPMGDLIEALVEADCELRITPSLWSLHDAVRKSSLEYSMIRMRNAGPR